jgi:hypothetical protein
MFFQLDNQELCKRYKTVTVKPGKRGHLEDLKIVQSRQVSSLQRDR